MAAASNRFPVTPSPSPSSPNVKQIDVVAIGLGAYDLAVIPVALLHNESTQNAALGISVTITVDRHGGTSPRSVPSDVTYDIPPSGTIASRPIAPTPAFATLA